MGRLKVGFVVLVFLVLSFVVASPAQAHCDPLGDATAQAIECVGFPGAYGYTAEAGNDTLTITGDYLTSNISGGDDDDTITNVGTFTNSSLRGAGGNDTILNNGVFINNSEILGEDGDDFINNSGNFSLSGILSGAGNDTIINSGDFIVNSAILAGDGDDLVIIMGDPDFDSSTMIDGGANHDILRFESNDPNAPAQIATFLAGNDILTNCGGVCTITLAGKDYRFQNFEELLGIVIQALQQAEGATIGIFVPRIQELCAHENFKVFRLPNGDLEVFGGFVFLPPNGFRVALVDMPSVATGITRFQDTGGANADFGWYAVITRGNANFIEVFDRNGNPVGRCNL